MAAPILSYALTHSLFKAWNIDIFSENKLPIAHIKAIAGDFSRINDRLSTAEWLFTDRLSRKFVEIRVLKLEYFKWKETYHVMLSWEHEKTSKLSVCDSSVVFSSVLEILLSAIAVLTVVCWMKKV